MYEEFREKERVGWGSKADFYKDHTALITTQAIPTLLATVRVRAAADFLDICTGPGYAAGAAEAVCANATGIDFAPEMVRAASKKFPDCNFMEGDAIQLDIPDETYDCVVCPFGIFHITNPAKAVAEAFRVLRPGGRYAFSQWCAPAESDFFRLATSAVANHADMSVADPAPDAFEYSDRDLCQDLMVATGFKDVEVREVPSVYHAPKGDLFNNVMLLSVRSTMIVEAQTDEVINQIKNDMNEAAESYKTEQGIVIPVPSFVVSGQK